MIDSHCHLSFDYSPQTEEEVIREAYDAGVSALINVGTDFECISRLQKTSELFLRVFHTVGIHPSDLLYSFSIDQINRLKIAARHSKCCAIGEIGLDYYFRTEILSEEKKEIQRSGLIQQLEIADEMGLPVVIHSREAESDLLDILRKYCASRKNSAPPGVIHCFTGSLEFGRACIDLGFYLSFSGILTFKNASTIQEAARYFPLNRLLIETDSPYLSPEPFRGKKCKPSFIRFTAEKLALLKNVSFQTVSEITTQNTELLFSISK